MADSVATHYTDEIREELEHLGTWRPNEQLRLGDLGRMEGNRFIRQSTVEAELGLSVGEPRLFNEENLSYRSEGTVVDRLGGSGDVSDPGASVAGAGSEIEISFFRRNAILLDMMGCTSSQVEDQLMLGREIREIWRDGRWDPKWCVITELVQAQATTVLVARGSQASIGFKANAKVELGDTFSLADAGLSLTRVRSTGIEFELVAAPGATPLMRGMRLKKNWWRHDPKVEIEGIEAMSSEDPFDAEEDPLRYFDLLGRD